MDSCQNLSFYPPLKVRAGKNEFFPMLAFSPNYSIGFSQWGQINASPTSFTLPLICFLQCLHLVPLIALTTISIKEDSYNNLW